MSEPNFYINDKDNLDNFLVEHSNFFHLEGDTIYLNDEVEISDLNALESYYRKSENISTRSISF